MTRSVFANSRNFSHKGSSDKSLSSPPDVCKTPVGSATPPIPYPVISQAQDLSKTTSSVLIDGNPTAIASSEHTQCSGDQAGSLKGLISGTTSDKTHFASYSFDVKAEGEGVVRHMDATTMNNRNTMGMNFGVASPAPALTVEDTELESVYLLRFQFVDELGQQVKNVPYKTLPAGEKKDLHIPDAKTDLYGKTFIASSVKDESIDCYISWKKFSAKDKGRGF